MEKLIFKIAVVILAALSPTPVKAHAITVPNNNRVGVLFPVVALPIASGDYLGKTYSTEINQVTTEPGGFVYESTKWVLEKLGIPTEKK
ncbi:hypothetical protein [Algoriphagus sp. Y33]|uniref:hypothetical protein n=1 Tax=Algoriphagus sp. Y33 TaxID=2772483 RepID=UPI001781A617|nr:hypothetical protein [Algoriphagus sp. Y33]